MHRLICEMWFILFMNHFCPKNSYDGIIKTLRKLRVSYCVSLSFVLLAAALLVNIQTLLPPAHFLPSESPTPILHLCTRPFLSHEASESVCVYVCALCLLISLCLHPLFLFLSPLRTSQSCPPEM